MPKPVVWNRQPDDLVVVVAGPKGVGKSTFIKTLMSGKVDPMIVQPPIIGDGRTACTREVQPFAVPISIRGRARRLIIVDTPGLDDNSRTLMQIKTHLWSSHEPAYDGLIILGESKLAGISVNVPEKHKTLSGDPIPSFLGAEQFESSGQFVWKIVNKILDFNIRLQILLELNDELVELEKNAPNTEAGKWRHHKLTKLLKTQLELEKKLLLSMFPGRTASKAS